nr:SDR family oxidoreductase [uncultured Desulfobacter sp.]
MNMRTIQNLINLEGRRALITGGAGHIGHAMAEAIAELGGGLILVDLAGADYPFLDRLKKLTDDIECIDCDLEKEDQRTKLMDKIKSDKKGLDILINSAAFVGTTDLKGWGTPFEEQTVDTWRRAVEVNLTACFDIIKQATPLLRESNHPSVINIGSTYGVVGPDYALYEGTTMGNAAAYAAAKGGLVQLTRWLATTLAPKIRINMISPGGVYRNQNEAFVNRYEARTPLERMATEEDFKGITAYLSSDLSNYVTGQNFMIDGGWTAW